MTLQSHGIVALVRDKSGKYLLLEDAREPMKGFWAPPHGRCMQSDPTEEHTVIRETREETGLLVRPIRKIHTQKADTKVKTVSFWFVQTDDVHVVLNAESSQYRWVTVQEALRMKLYPGTKDFFQKIDTGDIPVDL